MSIHSTFAENLRSKCMEHESIAAVCSGIGINRQQFNKYLAGSALPNAITLRKICKYLDVPEQALFLGGNSPVLNRESKIRFSGLATDPFSFLNSFHPASGNEENELRPGAYYCYFPLHNAPGMLLRSLVFVRRCKGQMSFSRLTVFPPSNGSQNYLAAGKHRGVVLSNGSELYFLGSNRYAPRQLSLMTIERISGSNQFFTGIIITRSGNELISSRLCLTYENERKTLREMIKELGFLHQQTSGLEPVLLAELHRRSSLLSLKESFM
jgi:transcriptional regulator with XRE-family HTH domain